MTRDVTEAPPPGFGPWVDIPPGGPWAPGKACVLEGDGFKVYIRAPEASTGFSAVWSRDRRHVYGDPRATPAEALARLVQAFEQVIGMHWETQGRLITDLAAIARLLVDGKKEG